MPEYYLRDLRLTDAGCLVRWLGEAVPPAARTGRNHKVTLAGLRGYIKKLEESPLFRAYAWEADTAGDEDEAPEVTGIVFCEQTALRPGLLQAEIILSPDKPDGERGAERLLDALFKKTGQDPAVKAVNLHVPEHYRDLTAACDNLPFEIPFERYPLGRSSAEREEQWTRLYTLSKTSNWPYTWVFVPTPMGLWAVYGNEHEISSLDWLDYEAPIEDIQLKELCIADGFADAHGRLLSRRACEHVMTPPGRRHVPDTLKEAVRQLRAYAAGELRHFDLPLAHDEGTRFQRAVWQEIAGIPYGATRSYEEVGIRLSGDEEKGRRMTRAVGAACAANPLAIFVPCHRVIAKDKKLQGYAFGVERKDWLLSLEILGAAE